MIDFDDLEERLRGRADGDDGLYADALDAIIGLRDTESSLRGALRLLRRQKDAEIARLRSEPPTEAGEQVGWGVMTHGYDESKPPAIGRPRDKWSVDEFFYPFQRDKAEEVTKAYVPEARAHVVPLFASPPGDGQ